MNQAMKRTAADSRLETTERSISHMTATTTAREAKRKDGEIVAYPMAAVKIPKGALVNINAAGYATNATDAAGETFAGVAYETVDNSAGSAGDLSIRVETTGTFVFVDGGGNGTGRLGRLAGNMGFIPLGIGCRGGGSSGRGVAIGGAQNLALGRHFPVSALSLRGHFSGDNLATYS